MSAREYVRLCKQAGCRQTFTVAATSLIEDRAIGFSEPEYCLKHRLLHAKSYSRIAAHHYDVELTPEGEELVRQLEQHKEITEISPDDLAAGVFDPFDAPGKGYGPGGLGRFTRPLRAFVANNAYEAERREFEIAKKTDEILAALDDHQVLILVGTTGSSKSTYVPWLLLTGGVPGSVSKWARRGPICVTQPRIQATQQVPRFIANSLNGTSVGPGSQIGFSHSKADEFDRRARLVFKTDGKLINDIVSGAIGNYSIVVIDEAHERSVNIDLILGLLRDQLYLYPHLRVIVASATIDFQAFLGYFYPGLKDTLSSIDEAALSTFNYFGHERKVPFVFAQGRRFPITEHWWGDPDADDELVPQWWHDLGPDPPSREDLPRTITDLVERLCLALEKRGEEDLSHILVFLPGTREIDQVVALINDRRLPNVIAQPLYAQRPLDEQEAALKPDPERHPDAFGKRRVVVSTNVAETSLTVEGVRYVVDSGYIKESYWNPATEVSELRTLRHSKAGCRQRWGRAGRTSPGHAYMLYTKRQFDDDFPVDTTPALARSSLEQVLLTAKAAGVRTARPTLPGKVLDFEWMPLAKQEDNERLGREMDRAYAALRRQGALDEEGDLTRFGLELRGTPAALEAARIAAEGERFAMGVEVATIVPFLKLEFGLHALLLWNREWDAYDKLAVRRSHVDLVHGCDDDLELYLKLWLLWSTRPRDDHNWPQRTGIDSKAFHEGIEEERRKFLQAAMDWRKAEQREVSLERLDALRALVGSCLPTEIYRPERAAAPTAAAAPEVGEPLMWEAYWEGTSVLGEHDEEDLFDTDFSALDREDGLSGVYRRVSDQDRSEASLIELSPTSMCRDNTDAELVVVCQRRANFQRPARAKILGLNVVRLQKEWLGTLHASAAARALLYASLSRARGRAWTDSVLVKLFLPWFFPRGSIVRATPRAGATASAFDIAIDAMAWKRLPGGMRSPLPEGLVVEGRIDTERSGHDTEVEACDLQVIGHERGSGGVPVLVLRRSNATGGTRGQVAALERKVHRTKTIVVEMREVIEDPLGRSPVFVVRDVDTGLEIPMADGDFCGGGRPQGYFGRRFAPGYQFEVDVESLDVSTGKVVLSRGRLLLREFAAVPHPDRHVVELPVKRVAPEGVYLILGGVEGAGHEFGYVGFVRRALWPAGFAPRPGDRVRARLRRIDRSVNARKLEDELRQGQPLPETLDLGIELDLLVPPAYDRFRQKHRTGDRITVTAEKPLDNGGLLVALDFGLKSVIFDSDLSLDADGNLRRGREYVPGEQLDARIVQMQDRTATVRCSLLRATPPPPGEFQLAQAREVRVLLVKPDFRARDEDRHLLICTLDDRYPVWVSVVPADAEAIPIGARVSIAITKIDRFTNLTEGTLLG